MRSHLELWWEQTESCQAKTSQATPTSQPQELSQSKSQNCIYFFKPRRCVSNVCMCTSTRACLLSSDKSNRVIYTGGKSLLLHSLSQSLFIPMPISSISQMTESCAAKLKCRCFIPGIPLCAADGWGRPEHRKGPAIQASIISLKLA